jgi:hypothetical protein
MNRQQALKLTIWDVLAILSVLAMVMIGIFYLQIMVNPYSAWNPFPPPTLPVAIVIPSDTPTMRVMPSTWTPTPLGWVPETPGGIQPTSTGQPSPTGFILPTYTGTPTSTGTTTTTPTRSQTPTATKTIIPAVARTSTAISNVFATATGASLNKTLTAMPTKTPTSMPNAKNVREKSGIQSNVWQKANSNPTFFFDVTPNMYEFYWYFERLKDGTSDTQRIAIRHDSKTVEFTPPPVTECGAYYLRIKIRYATKSGNTIIYSDSLWTTAFIFKYDRTPPVAPLYAIIGIKNAVRGIQNISGSPSFDWSGVNGADLAGTIWPEGDYIGFDLNEDGTKEPYLCSGIKGYNVYWGPDPQGVVSTKYVTSPKYKPATVKANTAYFLRVQSIDKLDNKSEWRSVALDESYDPVASGFADPTPEEAVFYYDTVRPNNIDGIVELNGHNSNDPFSNNRNLDFVWTGGQDPVGFNTDVIWGYDVLWSTDPAAKPRFQKESTYQPLLSTSGTYYLRVRAVDWAGNKSPDWVQFIYRFDNIGPIGVTSVVEANSVKSNTYYNSPNPFNLSFSWDATKLKDPGDSKTSSGIEDSVWVYWGTDPAGTPFLPLSILTNEFSTDSVTDTGVYYLRFMTRDYAGNETITTPFVFKFDIDVPNDPVITELGGASHDTDQSTVNNPNFSWTASDVGSGIKGYKYCWAKDNPCTPDKFVSTGGYNPPAVPAGVYFLEVYTIDNAGNLSATTEFIFRYTP